MAVSISPNPSGAKISLFAYTGGVIFLTAAAVISVGNMGIDLMRMVLGGIWGSLTLTVLMKNLKPDASTPA